MIDNKHLEEELMKETYKLSELREKLQLHLENAPEGTLNIKKPARGNYLQYYNYLKGEKIYIPTKKRDLAKALAQKDYNKKVLSIIEARLRSAQQLLEQYKQAAGDLYNKLPAARKNLVTPIFPTDEEFVKAWYEKYPGSANPYPSNSVIYSERGELVRSKSEKILADLFYRRDIPYVYEPQIIMENGKILYPDFLLLNLQQRKTYVYEHFGMMDNPEYAKNMCEKIDLYSENGYWYGDNLLFSMETGTTPLNTRAVEKMLRHYLL